MDDGMQWLAGTILSAVISSVITVGFLSALVTRLQIRISAFRKHPAWSNVKALISSLDRFLVAKQPH